MSRPSHYYRPYESEKEATDESDGTDEGTDDSEDEHNEDDTERIRAEQDPRYAILRTAGPSLNTVEQQNKYSSASVGAPYDTKTDIRSLVDHVYLDPPKTTKTSLVSIKSVNRDNRIFPTPYRFQIKLPRVYKDITKFQLVQMSFPNNASNVQASTLFTSSLVQLLMSEGVPDTCSSICISIANCVPASNAVAMVEQGRLNGSGEPLLTALAIPTGSYTDSQLAQQLTLQANSTPPLNLISYDDFKDIFINTRDIFVLFNEPGDNYISKTTNQQFGMHSKENIMNSYYTQPYIDSLPEITEEIAYVAYYFPVLKEVIATGRAQPFLQTAGMAYDDVAAAVMGPFQGLDSPLYYQLCQINRDALENYRPHLTFELRNVNKYSWTFNANEKRFITIHDTLHTSIQRDLGNQYQSILQQELSLSNLNVYSFQSIKTELTSYQSIYKHLERNLSTVLGQYHLVSDLQFQGGDIYSTTQSTFSLSDLSCDADFNAMFCFKSTIGRIFHNYSGTPMNFRSFSDYHSTLSSYYHIVQSTSSKISSINGSVHTDYHQYVSKKYGGVLPSSMIQNRSYMSNQGVPVTFVTNQNVYIPGQPMSGLTPRVGPVPMTAPLNISTLAPSETLPIYYKFPPNTSCSSICCTVIQNMINSWYSSVPVNTVINSMAYRLGILNMTPGAFNIFSTVSQITSTANTNLLMSINDAQGFNNMDITMPEDYNLTNETTGQVKLIAGKILMGAVGDTGVSQTVIQNPTVFENTLGKLDRLDIKIYYDDDAITPAWLYLPYFLSIQEWDATFQIDEQVGFANQNTGWGNRPSVPIPADPDSTPYIHFTHKNNPNNS
jgi:hypothetical protein